MRKPWHALSATGPVRLAQTVRSVMFVASNASAKKSFENAQLAGSSVSTGGHSSSRTGDQAMEETLRCYRALSGNRAYLRSVCEGAAFLAASSIAIYAAVAYATIHASNPVTDLVLSRVGPLNVRFLFVYGTFSAFVITAGLLAWRP